MHDTKDHMDTFSKPTQTPTLTPSLPPSPISEFPKKYTDKGPLIESVDGEDEKLPTIRINRRHKHYDKLRDLLRE